jgi:hypothetical protein
VITTEGCEVVGPGYSIKGYMVKKYAVENHLHEKGPWKEANM